MSRDRWAALFRDPGLRRRILVTIGILILFRLLVHIPVMEFDQARLDRLIRDDQYVFAWDMGSGGALATLSVLALGMAPHFGAQGLLSGAAQFSKSLGEIARTDPDKTKRIQYGLAIPVGLLQIVLLFGYLQREGAITRFSTGISDLLYLATKVVVLIAGSFFVSWLADRISEDGVGGGFPVLVFGGVAARLPALTADLWREGVVLVIVVVGVLTATLFVSIMVETGKRNVRVEYPAYRTSRARRYGTRSFLPVWVNPVGTGPLEVSLSLIAMLAFLAIPIVDLGGSGVAEPAAAVVGLLKGPAGFWVLYVLGTLYFAVVYRALAFEPYAMASVLRRHGGLIPGVPPGEATARYLGRIGGRIWPVGLVYLGAMAILPYVLGTATGVQSTVFDAALAALLGFDTVLGIFRQVEAYLNLHSYDGLLA
jgi:preprotein translocase subunit SecY